MNVCRLLAVLLPGYFIISAPVKAQNFGLSRIPPKPPGKSFRILALYFKLADDQFELGEATAGWPHTNSVPNWKGQFLIDQPYAAATFTAALAQKPQSLTAYFYQMSNGHLWLYGEEIAYTGPPLTEN